MWGVEALWLWEIGFATSRWTAQRWKSSFCKDTCPFPRWVNTVCHNFRRRETSAYAGEQSREGPEERMCAYNAGGRCRARPSLLCAPVTRSDKSSPYGPSTGRAGRRRLSLAYLNTLGTVMLNMTTNNCFHNGGTVLWSCMAL
jgi:hypothetical protein